MSPRADASALESTEEAMRNCPRKYLAQVSKKDWGYFNDTMLTEQEVHCQCKGE